MEQELLGIIGQRDLRQPVFLSHLHGKEAEEQENVVASVAQGRHLDRDGVEPVIEIFAEPSFRDGLAHVDIGRCHDAHIGLADLLTADTDILARLQHTEQAGLRRHGQLADLIEKDRTFIGNTKVAVGLAHGARIGTFLVAEELTVDRSLRDRSAVDRKIFLAATR